jgi:diacylglycerol kinase (ATP)
MIRLKNLTESTTVRVVIAGGDGTIMWVIESMISHEVEVDRCVIVPLPLGTGNDFSNSLGTN